MSRKMPANIAAAVPGTPRGEAVDALFKCAPLVVRAVGCGVSNRELGMTFQQIRTILFVAHCPRCLGDIARERSVSAASASVLVDGLEQDGYVLRTPDRVDGRRIIVTLTDKGRSAYESIRASSVTHFAELVDPLTDEEASELARLLRKIQSAAAL